MTKFTINDSTAPPPKIAPRRSYTSHSWPGLASSHSTESIRFVSEHGPRYTSAQLVGGNSLITSSTVAETRNDKPSIRHETAEEKRVMPRWNVTSVRPVPTYYPLEKSCITVEGVPLSVLCERISNFMRMNSICCTFHKHHVDCATMGLLKFVIHLWKTRTNNNGVIVEIQRRQGCAIQLQHVRHGLVQAITSGQAPIVTCERLNTHTVDCNILDQLDTKNECIHALKITKRLLESDQYDQNRLGMESLASMTNPATVLKKDAKFVCRALVCGDAPLGDCLRDAMVPYFQEVERDDDDIDSSLDYDSDEDSDEEEYAQGTHFGAMHQLALRVMANALQVVSELDDGRPAAPLSIVDLASPFWSSVCNALVYNIEEANHRPREAALSAQSLNLLTQLAPILCECPIMDRLVPALSEANACGKSCSLLLERESQQLMGTLAGAG